MVLSSMAEAADALAVESYQVSSLVKVIASACLTWYVLVIAVQIVGITQL
jgi:hypothetical protein